ncbi:MAG TPA: T9SS type A sorting domain-containing protein [Parafilimonas sp.]|nr:T9SS type A sorting domain-containing protein [Parafilimonas sp.]
MKKFIIPVAVKNLLPLIRKEKFTILLNQNKFRKKALKPLCISLVFIIALVFNAAIKLNAQTKIKYGENVQGSISAAAETDAYTFTGKKNDIITILVAKSSNYYFTVMVKIYSPDNILLRTEKGNSIKIDTMKLLKSGKYKIIISDDNYVETGGYGFSLWRIHPPMGTSISYGQNLQDTLPVVADINGYTFYGNTNDMITLLLAKSSNYYYTPMIEIYDPDGYRLKQAQANAIRIDTMTLLKTGLYTILVLDNDGFETGTYGLTLRRINPVMGTNINYGKNLQGILPSVAAINGYTFNGKKDDIITLLLAKSSNYYFTPTIEIYDPDGYRLKQAQANAIRIDTMTLLKTGLYTILVLDNDGFETGTYGLTLRRINPPTGKHITYGTNLQDTLSSVAAINSYIFKGFRNNIITLLVSKTSNYYFTPKVEIYDPNGVLLRRAEGNTIIIDTLKLLKTGQYTILVMDNDGFETGTYGLSLPCVTGEPHIKTITGPGNVNAGVSYSYEVPFVAGSKWKWKAPGAVVTQHKNTADIIWDTLGQQTIKVAETNENGCTGATAIKNVNVHPLKITNAEVSKFTLRPGSGNDNDYLQVFPNPATKTVFIVFTAKEQISYSFELKDISGKILLSKNGRSIIGKNKISIDISKYAQGIYFVTFNNEHIQRSLKLVKE